MIAHQKKRHIQDILTWNLDSSAADLNVCKYESLQNFTIVCSEFFGVVIEMVWPQFTIKQSTVTQLWSWRCFLSPVDCLILTWQLFSIVSFLHWTTLYFYNFIQHLSFFAVDSSQCCDGGRGYVFKVSHHSEEKNTSKGEGRIT